MTSVEVKKQYKITVGIECHVQLKTHTKLFAPVANDARDAEPNTLISHICLGMPGALPVLNKEAVYLAAKAAFALGTVPQTYSSFDRKHYFYPDLPKGYQITQFAEPIIIGGSLSIVADGLDKTIGITRAHIEEDAGKSTHPAGKDYSLVDLNRAGTPLLEIVSEPEIHTPAEAKSYARELYLRMKYADVSDANLYYGNMRFDVNVSVSKTDEFGTRTETKNINSFRAVEKVVEYESNRQISVLESGGEIVQETRGWDENAQKTISQRTKEDAHDYRYFPDPDLPPIVLDEKYIADVKAEMPRMPDEWRDLLRKLDVDKSYVEVLLDAQIDMNSKFLDSVVSRTDPIEAKMFANWIVNIEIPMRKELTAKDQKIEIDDYVRTDAFLAVNNLVQAGKLSSNNATALIKDILLDKNILKNVEIYAEDKGYIQESDESAISAIVDKVIADNPKAADDVKNGEMKAIGFLVGQVMKQSNGKANPGLAKQLLTQKLQ